MQGLRAVLRAIAQTAREIPGVSEVPAVACLAAGAALIGVAGIQVTAHRVRLPLASNVWFRFGLGLMLLGLVLAFMVPMLYARATHIRTRNLLQVNTWITEGNWLRGACFMPANDGAEMTRRAEEWRQRVIEGLEGIAPHRVADFERSIAVAMSWPSAVVGSGIINQLDSRLTALSVLLGEL